ncbi:TPA: UPF0223 family protein [Staphylococcus aureus]
MEYEYPIDLDWSNEEMISVINFFNHVEKYYESGVTAGDFMDAYKRFKEIVPAKAEEKQIFNTFEKSSGYNSYKAVQGVKNYSEEQRVTAKK